MKKYFILFLAILLAPALAEVMECINSSATCPTGMAVRNMTIVTGFQGATVVGCNAAADCVDTGWFKCFSDWDGTGPDASNAGWCNSTAITNCYSNASATSGASRAYPTGYNLCTTSTAYRQCSSGAWGSETACSGNQTCTSNTSSPCGTSSSSSSSSSSSGGSNATPTPTPSAAGSLAITSAISDFDLVQNDSVVKSLIAKNSGNKSLTDVKITVPLPGISTGINEPRYTISPDKFANLSKNSIATFIFNFSATPNATIKSYTITTEVAAAEAKTSATFTLRILPSNATVESSILPLYSSLKLQIAGLELNVTELDKQGINTTAMRRLLSDIRDKLNQTENNIQKKNYFEAAQLLDSAKALVADLQSSISKAKAPATDFVLILIIIVIIAAIGIVAYLMWPVPEEGFAPKKGWQKEQESMVNRILEKIKRKKKEGYVPG